MKGPTIWRLAEGRARRTCISPRSTARGIISISIASALTRSPGTGSAQGLQLIIVLQKRRGSSQSSVRSGAIAFRRPACVSIRQLLQQISVVVLRRVHARRNRPDRHRIGGEGLEEVWPVRIEGEPPAVVFRPEDRRHAVVNSPDKLVCGRGDDAEGSDPFPCGGVLPVLPKAGEAEGRAVLHRNGVGLLHLRALDCHPLEEAVDRHDAAALAVCRLSLSNQRGPSTSTSSSRVRRSTTSTTSGPTSSPRRV